jgi:hypothetical protein
MAEYLALSPEERAVRHVTAGNWPSLCLALAAGCLWTQPQVAADFEALAEWPTPAAESMELLNKLTAVAVARCRANATPS